METLTIEKPTTTTDFLPLNGTDHVEFYVGNAKQAAYFYKSAFGFKEIAYAGPETGARDIASYVLEQGKIRLVLTTPLKSNDPRAEHIRRHGDGVKMLALSVNDAYDAFYQTTSRGAEPYLEPHTLNDEHGELRVSGIKLYGETV